MAENHAAKHPPLLDVGDVCRLLKLSRQQVYELMKRGEIAYAQLGGRRRIRQSDLDAYIESRLVEVRR